MFLHSNDLSTGSPAVTHLTQSAPLPRGKEKSFTSQLIDEHQNSLAGSLINEH